MVILQVNARTWHLGGLAVARGAMVLLMQFIAISAFTASAVAQPTPEEEKKWEALSLPRIKTRLDQELPKLPMKNFGKTTLTARCYLEKNGSIRKLRIDKTETICTVAKTQLPKLEKALLSAVQTSAPFAYFNAQQSALPHVGLYVQWQPQGNVVSGGLTHPEDCP